MLFKMLLYRVKMHKVQFISIGATTKALLGHWVSTSGGSHWYLLIGCTLPFSVSPITRIHVHHVFVTGILFLFFFGAAQLCNLIFN